MFLQGDILRGPALGESATGIELQTRIAGTPRHQCFGFVFLGRRDKAGRAEAHRGGGQQRC